MRARLPKASFSVLLLLSALWVPVLTSAEDWPGWRGDGSGVSPDARVVESWSDDRSVRWKTAIPGVGHSSPVVWKDRVFVTTARDGVERQTARIVTTALLWALAVGAVWWCSGTFFRHLFPESRALSRLSFFSVDFPHHE